MTLFAFRMAWRETRAAWRHFLYFFVCIALGVGALVGVALFSANVERAVTREARGLMGGDVEIRLSRPMSGKGEAVLRSLADRGIAVLHVSELAGMAAVVDGTPALQTQLVELKAVEPAYPFYGMLQVEPHRPLMELLSESACPEPRTSNRFSGRSRHSSLVTRDGPCHGAVVQQSLLIRLGLSAFFAMNAMMFSLPAYFPFFYPTAPADPGEGGFLLVLRVLSLLFSLPVFFLLGVPILIQSLRQVRQAAAWAAWQLSRKKHDIGSLVASLVRLLQEPEDIGDLKKNAVGALLSHVAKSPQNAAQVREAVSKAGLTADHRSTANVSVPRAASSAPTCAVARPRP